MLGFWVVTRANRCIRLEPMHWLMHFAARTLGPIDPQVASLRKLFDLHVA
jgi:hypothetical protein